MFNYLQKDEKLYFNQFFQTVYSQNCRCLCFTEFYTPEIYDRRARWKLINIENCEGEDIPLSHFCKYPGPDKKT